MWVSMGSRAGDGGYFEKGVASGRHGDNLKIRALTYLE